MTGAINPQQISAGLVNVPLNQPEFLKLQQLIHAIAGIHMTEAKKPLISERLYRRLQHHRLNSYADYLSLLARDQNELKIAVALLTTNETHSFRGPKHLPSLQQQE